VDRRDKVLDKGTEVGGCLMGIAIPLCWVGAFGNLWNPLFWSFAVAGVLFGVGLLLIIGSVVFVLVTGGWAGLRMRLKALRRRIHRLPVEIEMPPFARVDGSRLFRQDALTPIMESLVGDRLVNGKWPEGEARPDIPVMIELRRLSETESFTCRVQGHWVGHLSPSSDVQLQYSLREAEKRGQKVEVPGYVTSELYGDDGYWVVKFGQSQSVR
jgi:hypothetical protein